MTNVTTDGTSDLKVGVEPRPPLIVYHFNCMDGLGALWAAKRAIPDADVWSGSYGQKPPSPSRLAGRDVIVVDFSYGIDDLRQMASVARSVLVLDHHDTAREDLAQLTGPSDVNDWRSWRRYLELLDEAGRTSSIPPVAIFDLNRSGAGLTWDFFHPDEPRPRVIDLIEDRDLWRFQHQETRAFHALLIQHDKTNVELMLILLSSYDIVSRSDDAAWSAGLTTGAALVKFEASLVASAVASSERTMSIGHEVAVPVANVPGQLASEAGNLLVERHPEAPFVATYYDGKDGKRHFSLRSGPDKEHVGQVARLYGGGGHPRAAGFDQPIGWDGECAPPSREGA